MLKPPGRFPVDNDHRTARFRLAARAVGTSPDARDTVGYRGAVDAQGPLAGSYRSAVVLVLLALMPYLMLTTAAASLAPMIQRDLAVGATAYALTIAGANAAYCFGTVASIQLSTRFPPRRLLLGYLGLMIVGALLVAWSPAETAFVVGWPLMGLATSLMLIAAAPALIIGWPVARMRTTATVMNLGIFGAVALGPVLGGLFAGAGTWRALVWIVLAVSVAALVLAVLTFQDQPPVDPEAPVDIVAMVLAGLGCGASFFGAAMLQTHDILAPTVLAPMLAGLLTVAVLVGYEMRQKRPLMPVRNAAQTIATSGIVVAMAGGLASVGLVGLTRVSLQASGSSQVRTALLFLPEVLAALVTAVVFGRILFTRYPPVMAVTGLVLTAAGGAILLTALDGAAVPVLLGTGLVGLGIGASVAPALFSAGFSMPSSQLPKIFALIELLRGLAAFLAGPMFLHLASHAARDVQESVRIGLWVGIGAAAAGAVIVVGLWLLAGQRLRRPQSERWLEGDGTATEGRPLLALLRSTTKHS